MVDESLATMMTDYSMICTKQSTTNTVVYWGPLLIPTHTSIIMHLEILVYSNKNPAPEWEEHAVSQSDDHFSLNMSIVPALKQYDGSELDLILSYGVFKSCCFVWRISHLMDWRDGIENSLNSSQIGALRLSVAPFHQSWIHMVGKKHSGKADQPTLASRGSEHA